MILYLDTIRGIGTLAILVKLICAVLCGGLIGIEREYKRRPAGFRTHILVCLGAAMTTITSQYLIAALGQYADPGRLGAQVVAGIGFMGAGTIIVSKRNRVKGLTTAAGLWTTAILGLSIGTGFYECAILATIMILIAELFLSKLEYSLHSKMLDMNIYIEYSGTGYINNIIDVFKQREVKIVDVEIIKKKSKDSKQNIAIFTVQVGKRVKKDDIIQALKKFSQTKTVEIL